MFSIRCQDVSWAILLISCWSVGRCRNAAVNWFSVFKCREQRWGPGPQSAQWPTLCSWAQPRNISIHHWTQHFQEQSGGHNGDQRRPKRSWVLPSSGRAPHEEGKFIMWSVSCMFFHMKLGLNNNGSIPLRWMLQHFLPRDIFVAARKKLIFWQTENTFRLRAGSNLQL